VANSKEPYILLSIYQNMYQNKYGKMPSLNKYREKWAMQDVIDSIGYGRAKELIEYYFTTGKNGHPLQFFFFNFDKIDIMEKEIKKDKTNRRILQEATKKLVEGENE
jgi:hypothetical protein